MGEREALRSLKATALILMSAGTVMPEGNVEVLITQTPHDAPSQPFNAPGLGWGGEATWKYVGTFAD